MRWRSVSMKVPSSPAKTLACEQTYFCRSHVSEWPGQVHRSKSASDDVRRRFDLANAVRAATRDCRAMPPVPGTLYRTSRLCSSLYLLAKARTTQPEQLSFLVSGCPSCTCHPTHLFRILQHHLPTPTRIKVDMLNKKVRARSTRSKARRTRSAFVAVH